MGFEANKSRMLFHLGLVIRNSVPPEQMSENKQRELKNLEFKHPKNTCLPQNKLLHMNMNFTGKECGVQRRCSAWKRAKSSALQALG